MPDDQEQALEDCKACARISDWDEDILDGDMHRIESNVAAACSLLPALAKRMEEMQSGPGPGLYAIPSWADYLAVLMEGVRRCLWQGDDKEVCRLIVEAVRKVSEEKP